MEHPRAQPLDWSPFSLHSLSGGLVLSHSFITSMPWPLNAQFLPRSPALTPDSAKRKPTKLHYISYMQHVQKLQIILLKISSTPVFLPISTNSNSIPPAAKDKKKSLMTALSLHPIPSLSVNPVSCSFRKQPDQVNFCFQKDEVDTFLYFSQEVQLKILDII